MAEAATSTPSAEPVVAAPVVSDSISDFVGEKGELKGDWINSLVPEDLRGETVFKEMANNPELNVKDAFKMVGNLQRVIGKKGIIPPPKDSTPTTHPTEWNEYYKAIGRPDKPDGYKLEYPKDMPTPEVPELRQAFLKHSFELGKTPAQVKADYDFYNNIVKQAVIQQKQQEKAELDEAERIIHEESGIEYDNRLHIASKTIDEGTGGWSQERKDKFLAEINKSSVKPYVMDFLANIGKKFMESAGVPAGAEKSSGMTPAEANTRMNEIAVQLADTTLVYKNAGLHARLTAEMASLAKLITK